MGRIISLWKENWKWYLRWAILIIYPFILFTLRNTLPSQWNIIVIGLGCSIYGVVGYFLCQNLFAPTIIFIAEFCLLPPAMLKILLSGSEWSTVLITIIYNLSIIIMCTSICGFLIQIGWRKKGKGIEEKNLQKRLGTVRWMFAFILPAILNYYIPCLFDRLPMRGSIYETIIWVLFIPILYGILGYYLVKRWYIPLTFYIMNFFLINLSVRLTPLLWLYSDYISANQDTGNLLMYTVAQRLLILPFVLLGTLLAMLFVHLYRTRKKKEALQAAEAK